MPLSRCWEFVQRSKLRSTADDPRLASMPSIPSWGTNSRSRDSFAVPSLVRAAISLMPLPSARR